MSPEYNDIKAQILSWNTP